MASDFFHCLCNKKFLAKRFQCVINRSVVSRIAEEGELQQLAIFFLTKNELKVVRDTGERRASRIHSMLVLVRV